ATPAARASAMRRASIRIRDRRNSSSRAAIRYDFGTRNFSTAARPMNSVRRSSASAPRLMSIAWRCGGPGKNLLRNLGAPGWRGDGCGATGRGGGGGRAGRQGGDARRGARLHKQPLEGDGRRPLPYAPARTARRRQDLVRRGAAVRVVAALGRAEV